MKNGKTNVQRMRSSGGSASGQKASKMRRKSKRAAKTKAREDATQSGQGEMGMNMGQCWFHPCCGD